MGGRCVNGLPVGAARTDTSPPASRPRSQAKSPLFYLLSTVFLALGGVLTLAPQLLTKPMGVSPSASFMTALAAALSCLLSGMCCTTGSPAAAAK